MHAAAADGVPQAPQGSAAPEQQQQQQQPSQRQDDPGSTLQQEHNAANPAQGPPARQPVPAPVGAYTQREEHLMRQEASGEIEFAYVLNDGQPINLIRLMGLKVIFSKQLPNMPREYICRLLLDRRHRSCALVARNGQVLGGVTYRVFPQQGLGEIAFCAVSASQQVRGFGTRLMNHTKAMARDRDHISYFLTYADNNAVGYFKKQGFTREITLPRDRWVGFIKDYDGGTLMECAIHPKLPYTDLVSMFRVQKEYLDSQIRQLSNSHVVHPGMPRQRLPMPGPSHLRVQDLPVPMQPGDVPGVKEAGWSASGKPGYKFMLRDNSVVDATPSNLHTYLEELLAALEALDDSWPFRAPVDPAEALDYYDIIHDPVDMLLIAGRLASRAYYASLEMFVADVRKMCDNCKYYNAQSTPYYQCAVKVQNYLDNYLDATVTEAAAQQQQPQQQRS
ncbi:histone acetyltransferase [Scenedesmus sp. NREL 46B-D3]|nr:histone acetyltransferase [Scenedesmus sp. NREL 46B-D3]